MKNLFKEAHKMTREIVNTYKDVDYKTQFGLNLAYLLNNKEEVEMKNDTVKRIEEVVANFNYKSEKQELSVKERFEKLVEGSDKVINSKGFEKMDDVNKLWTLGKEFKIPAKILKAAEEKIHDELEA